MFKLTSTSTSLNINKNIRCTVCKIREVLKTIWFPCVFTQSYVIPWMWESSEGRELVVVWLVVWCHWAVVECSTLHQIRGYGASGDGHHITQPHPSGIGAATAMRRALQGSGVNLKDVAYLNAHATSTPMGTCLEPFFDLRGRGGLSTQMTSN